MYATRRDFSLLALGVGAISLMLMLNYIGDHYDHGSLRDDVNSLQYKAHLLNKHRHADSTGTPGGLPINNAGSYLSGAWF
jgi:hypothetical protein